MYHKKQHVNYGSYSKTTRPFCSDERIYRPLSFYVRGGVDLAGQDRRQPLPSVADDADAPGEINLLTDATVDRLDLADLASGAATVSERRALEKATKDKIDNPE